MIRINLQTAGQRKQRRRAAADAGGGSGAVLPALMLLVPIAGGAGGSYYVHANLLGQIEGVQDSIRKGEAELARLKPILDEINQFKKDQALLEKKLAAIDELQAARIGPVRVFAELAALMPPQVWVTSIREKGGRTTIDGLGLDSQSIAIFANALARSPYFANVELTAVDQAQYLGLDVKKFNVTCRFQNPAAKRAEAQATAAGGQPAGRAR
ncbi:MAG TPA: PilN domain-containing protein [Thermodesulfobacteriota bacterium]